MKLAFTKMHGAGNDFVVVDHREPFLPRERAGLLSRLCDRRRGIGADGVLLLERDPSLDFAFVYYNSDGGPADFCGNGARCLARFALDRGLGAKGAVRFRTAVGEKRATLLPDGRVALEFGAVGAPERVSLDSSGRNFEGVLVSAGVPHFVVPVPAVDAVPLAEWSPPLRRHARFGAEGANVDFVARRADGRVAMRTFERGVEAETLACGSGAIATAAWARDEGIASPVVVCTAGGDDLVVEFTERELERGPERHATLTGPARVVYTGEWSE